MQPPAPDDEQQPHYLKRSAETAAWAAYEERDKLQRRSRRDLIFGPAWILFGIVLTLMSLGSGGTIVFVVWGPVVWGAYLIFRGLRHRD